MKSLESIWNIMAVLLVGALLAMVLLLGAFGSQALAQGSQTWYVDDDGGADFTKIQDAVDAVSAGILKVDFSCGGRL